MERSLTVPSDPFQRLLQAWHRPLIIKYRVERCRRDWAGARAVIFCGPGFRNKNKALFAKWWQSPRAIVNLKSQYY